MASDRKEYHKKYYSINKERIKSIKKEYELTHKKENATRSRKSYYANKERTLERQKIYCSLHREKIRESARKYFQNRDKSFLKTDEFRANRNHYQNEKRKTDIQFLLKTSLVKRMYSAVRNNQKSGSAVRDLGCTISELKLYLEGKFQDGMSWDNYGKWHIDHVIPLSFFDLTEREQFLKACHYTNLQPLWAVDNIKKSNKLVYTINS